MVVFARVDTTPERAAAVTPLTRPPAGNPRGFDSAGEGWQEPHRLSEETFPIAQE
ncbi:hypothetical protein GCM10027597_00660 [Saccharopolyspora tripterygii]